MGVIAYNKREIGKEKEKIAREYLENRGYQIVEQNYYSRYGEIDIIAVEQGYLVFVEVKYRKNEKVGYPVESIAFRKIHAIINTARIYLFRHKLSEDTPCRFDTISIIGNEITLIQNAFDISDVW